MLDKSEYTDTVTEVSLLTSLPTYSNPKFYSNLKQNTLSFYIFMCSIPKQRERKEEKEENNIRVTLGASFTCVSNFSINMKLLNVRIFFLSFLDFSKDVSSCYTLVFSFLSYIYIL
jgi:hypothetical protein